MSKESVNDDELISKGAKVECKYSTSEQFSQNIASDTDDFILFKIQSLNKNFDKLNKPMFEIYQPQS